MADAVVQDRGSETFGYLPTVFPPSIYADAIIAVDEKAFKGFYKPYTKFSHLGEILKSPDYKPEAMEFHHDFPEYIKKLMGPLASKMTHERNRGYERFSMSV